MTFHNKEGWNVIRESFNINQNDFSDSLIDDFKYIQGPRLIEKDNLNVMWGPKQMADPYYYKNVMWDPKQMTNPHYYKKEDKFENGKLRIQIIIYDPESGRLLYSEALV